MRKLSRLNLQSRKRSDCRSNKSDLGQIAQQEVLVFSFQFVVTLLTLDQRATLFLECLLEIANSFLKTDGHFRDAWSKGITELNLKLVFVAFRPCGFPQIGHFPDLTTDTVASVDYNSFTVDFAEPNKFPQRAERGRSVIMFGR